MFEVWQLFIKLFRMLFSFINGGEECVVCGSKTFLDPVCCKCRNTHFSVKDILSVKRCSICGKELISTEKLCLQCREKPVLVHTDKMIPLFSYRLWNKNLLFMWKISGQRVLSPFFAELVGKVLFMMKVKVIVPVPPRPKKIQKNGWDQITELCSFLHYRYGFQLLEVIQRHSATEQKKLDRNERLSQIEGAYSLFSEAVINSELKKFEGVFPENVCIVDDVCTTGSTLECCAKLLRENTSIKSIYGITLFTVD